MTRFARRKNLGAAFTGLTASLWLGVALNPAVATQAPAWPAVPGAVCALRDAKVTTPVTAFDAKGRGLMASDKERSAACRDGRPVHSGQLAAGAPAWGQRQLVLGAARSGADRWRGRMDAIALFARALTAAEAAGEAAASRALQAGRKPATSMRFRGTLVRQARTSALDEIRPLTSSLTAAEDKDEQVLAGEWKPPTLTVQHRMIMDGKRLPIAERKPGTAVELSAERLEENPQLEECRRDELEGAIDATLFYGESATAP